MSGNRTARMLRAYLQEIVPTLFFSGMFQSPSENFHTTEEVEIDIVRGDEDVSVVILDISTGYNMNATDIFTNKSFKPPIHKEAGGINAFDLIKRQAGDSPFQNPDFLANLTNLIFRVLRKSEEKIRRSVEWQAAQVLQTGVVALTDSNGNTLYSIDYKPKATHFPTVSVDWDQALADPIADLDSLARVIRSDGLVRPNQLVFGRDAWNNFIVNSIVQAHLNGRRIDQGMIAPVMRGEGATFMGSINIGPYVYDIWTYDGEYKSPETGVKIPFIADDKVIMRAANGRMDATFGAIPNIGAEVGRGTTTLIPGFPDRLSNQTGGMDMFTNVWFSPDKEQMFAGVGVRPLMIPTAIDTYGCLDTEA